MFIKEKLRYLGYVLKSRISLKSTYTSNPAVKVIIYIV